MTMKTLAIKKTVDAYPGLTPNQRRKLFHEEREIDRMKNEICKGMNWSYCGFSDEQVRMYHSKIFK